MTGIYIPLALAFFGFVAAFVSYRDIRRGGARFYTLEREAILRRASFTLVGSALLFTAAIALLVVDRQQTIAEETAVEGEAIEGVVTITPSPVVQQLPPLPTGTPTPDVTIPTATPTRPVCRAVVEGTFGNGLTLRDQPGGEEVTILAEADLVTVIDQSPTEANGIAWRQVRSLFGDEGWVAEQFLKLGTGCE
ncbi:MAG: SH3 domain-containing protein [Chloroflexi bacterium]|nr:SH3 domain-containing protein [Chloroflexota bacterium]